MPASDLLPPSPPPRASVAPPYGPPAAVVGRRPGHGRTGGAGDRRPGPPPVPPARPGRSTGEALRYAAPALLSYAGVRALGLLVLAGWAAAEGGSAHTLLSARWDSLWYARIAEDGYGYIARLPDGGTHPDLAFFPLLPALERGLSALVALSAPDAGLAVSAVSSLCAAAALFAIGDRLHGRRAGVTLAVLWAALPVGIVQSMAYSESLFTALAGWGVYAVLTGRWVWAGTLAAFAGLTRPVGAAVVAAVWLTAAERFRRERRWEPRVAAGVLLAPLGWFGYVGWVGLRTGSPVGYLDVQGQWGNGFDGGLAFAAFVWKHLTGSVVGGVGLLAGVALVVWLYVLCVRRGQPLPLLAYAGTVVVLALCAKGYFGSKPRLLLPAFPLLLPAAAALARWRTAASATVLIVAAFGAAVYGAVWLHGSGPP
ncbi:mannosyltransferase family protein [Streptomyces radiopugnans]|uniref:Mannosyltransferase (PIG-V) n=1 Tax=Streptomyces radiopugnans TaxID=403935 RepID=A0A1H9JKF1_9ACTN|nr:mannosyltransferase family protein [Streptomyces radiopugnans]SEQ87279.1 Mannosyltransferase (PIG-V) [Streptomyces radiopugnans]